MDMTPEFIALAATLVLALVQILAAGAVRTSELGARWNAGPRDGDVPPPGKLAGRLKRAQDNLFETLPLFIAAVLMAEVAGKTGDLTALGAYLYFFGRLVYVPIYALGIPYLRSAVWGVAAVGLILIIAALFV